MFDLSVMMEKQVLKRKCTLLRSLKVSFESLMFERSGSTSWQFSFSSGTLTMFCRHLLECLLDGAGSSTTTTNSSPGEPSNGIPVAALFWSLVMSVLGSLAEFKSVREQMPSSSGPAESYDNVLIEWIFFSLRHHCLLLQIQSLLTAPDNDLIIHNFHNSGTNSTRPPLLTRHFSQTAFLLDPDYVHDFLLYIK